MDFWGWTFVVGAGLVAFGVAGSLLLPLALMVMR